MWRSSWCRDSVGAKLNDQTRGAELSAPRSFPIEWVRLLDAMSADRARIAIDYSRPKTPVTASRVFMGLFGAFFLLFAFSAAAISLVNLAIALFSDAPAENRWERGFFSTMFLLLTIACLFLGFRWTSGARKNSN
jgi:hypothetical protein